MTKGVTGLATASALESGSKLATGVIREPKPVGRLAVGSTPERADNAVGTVTGRDASKAPGLTGSPDASKD